LIKPEGKQDDFGLKATNMSISSASILIHPLKNGSIIVKDHLLGFIKHGWKIPQKSMDFCHGDVRDVPVTFPQKSKPCSVPGIRHVPLPQKVFRDPRLRRYLKDGNVFLTAPIHIHLPWGWGL
jgi:hypothetical protein